MECSSAFGVGLTLLSFKLVMKLPQMVVAPHCSGCRLLSCAEMHGAVVLFGMQPDLAMGPADDNQDLCPSGCSGTMGKDTPFPSISGHTGDYNELSAVVLHSVFKKCPKVEVLAASSWSCSVLAALLTCWVSLGASHRCPPACCEFWPEHFNCPRWPNGPSLLAEHLHE